MVLSGLESFDHLKFVKFYLTVFLFFMFYFIVFISFLFFIVHTITNVPHLTNLVFSHYYTCLFVTVSCLLRCLFLYISSDEIAVKIFVYNLSTEMYFYNRVYNEFTQQIINFTLVAGQ